MYTVHVVQCFTHILYTYMYTIHVHLLYMYMYMLYIKFEDQTLTVACTVLVATPAADVLLADEGILKNRFIPERGGRVGI